MLSKGMRVVEWFRRITIIKSKRDKQKNKFRT